jgi:hypothetical protein
MHPAIPLYNATARCEIEQRIKDYLRSHTNGEDDDPIKAFQDWLAELDRLNLTGAANPGPTAYQLPQSTDYAINEAGAWTAEQVMYGPENLDEYDLVSDGAVDKRLLEYKKPAAASADPPSPTLSPHHMPDITQAGELGP